MIEAAVALYRSLLRLYPERFRDAYGNEMVELFRARLERIRRRRRWALVPATLVSVADLLWSALVERVRSKRRRRDQRRGQSFERRRDPVPVRALQSLRGNLRSLARQPTLVVAVVVTLTLGCGATLALVAIVDGAVLRPLPFPEPERLVSIVQPDPKFGLVPFAPPYLDDLRERATSFDLVVGFSPSWALTLVGLGEPHVITSAFVSDGLFDLVGARVVEGRGFTEADYLEGAPPVALVTREFWTRHFGNAPFSEHGVRLDGTLHTIVGIVLDNVRLPITASVVSRQGRPAEVFLPFASNPYADTRAVPVMNVVGRLRPNVTLEEARAELGSVGKSLQEDFPETSRLEVTGVSLHELVTRDSRGTVWMLFGAASALLLIACANVANLLLARAAGRQTEMAIRAALGAKRRDVVAQLLGESLLLALSGAAFGLVVAWWLLKTIPASGLLDLPPSASIGIDARVAFFAVVLATVTSLLFGLAPALYGTRRAGASVLRAARSTKTTGRARGILVAAELALAVFLLIGAGLLARSYWNLLQVDPGFRAGGLLGVPVDLSSDTYGDPERRRFVGELLERLQTLPNVTSAGAVNRLPLSGANVFVGVEVEGLAATGDEEPVVDRRVITPGYLQTMGIPILEGRDVGPGDLAESTPIAVVNDTLARRFWSEGALGRRVRLLLRSGPGPWLTVVGISGDVRHHGLDAAPEPELYVPYDQASVASMVAVVRTPSDPLTLAREARETVWALDPSMPLDGLGPVSRLVQESIAEPRFRMLVLNGFGALALLLAAVGVYGVMAFSVASRTHEIGLRMALGAGARSVMKLVVGRGMALAGWGVAVGLGAACGLSRLLQGILFGVTATDGPTFLAVSILLLGVAAGASYIPARRASRVDPVEALRVE